MKATGRVEPPAPFVPAARPAGHRTAAGLASAEAYARRHGRLDQYIAAYALPAALMRRVGIEFDSGRGLAAMFVLFFATIFVPVIAIAALTGTLEEWLPLRAAFVAAALATVNVVTLILIQAAVSRIVSIHRALLNEDEIQALVRWDRRWYASRTSALAGGVIATVFMVVLYVLTLNVTGIPLSPATVFVGAAVALFLGQYTFGNFMVSFEFRRFASARFSLYALSPIDTYAVQSASAGLKQLGIVSIAVFPLSYLVLFAVLPEAIELNVAVTGAFLLMNYLATGVGILLPLHFLGEIVKAEKQRFLEPLQARLNQMVAGVPDMSRDEHDSFVRLQALHATIASSKESLLDLGQVTRIIGAGALSTITVVAAALLQSWVQGRA
jgi:hypothetical protein